MEETLTSKFGSDLIRSAREAVAIAKGDMPPVRSYAPEAVERALRAA